MAAPSEIKYLNRLRGRVPGTDTIIEYKLKPSVLSIDMTFLEDKIEVGVPLVDKESGKPYITEDYIDSTSLAVQDVRVLSGTNATNYLPTPATMPDRSVGSYFSMAFAGGSWRSGLAVKGWTGSDYASWVLSGNAATSDNNEWYLRQGRGENWGRDNRIWHDGNTQDLIKLIYPIGAIYISVSNTNPGTLFGGTWVAFGTGRTLIGVNTGDTAFNTVEKTGGAKTNTLAVANLPSHNHTFSSGKATSAGAHTHATSGTAASSGAHTHTLSGTAASAGAHSHVQHSSTWMNAAGKVRMPASGSLHATINDTSDGIASRLATDSAGAHTHTLSGTATSAGAHTHTTSGTAASAGAHEHTVTGTIGNTGSGTAFNTMDPYITVYMWKRTA